MDCSPSGSSIHGILQARILEWAAIPCFRGSSQPKDWTQFSCFAARSFTIWVTGEAQFLCVETWTTSDALWIRLAFQRISPCYLLRFLYSLSNYYWGPSPCQRCCRLGEQGRCSRGQMFIKQVISNACMLSRFSRVQLFLTPWTVAHQASLSMILSQHLLQLLLWQVDYLSHWGSPVNSNHIH